MASYPAPTNSLTVFNPSNYDATYDSDTISYADTRYLNKSNGGTVSGNTTFSKTVTASTATTTKGTYVLGSTATFDGSGNGKFSTGCFTGTQG